MSGIRGRGNFSVRGGATRGGARGGAIRGGRGVGRGVSRSDVPQSSKPIPEKKPFQLQPVFLGKKQSTYFNELKQSQIPYLGGSELRDLKLKLINIVSASLIKEPRINQLTPVLESIMTTVYQIAYYDPEFILKLALYTRDELGIRTVANYLIVLASLLPLCQPYLKKYFKDLIKLPSDWLELPNIIKNLTESKSLPKSLRNVMVEKFSDFDTYQLGKYNTEGKMKRKRKKLKFLMEKNPTIANEIKKQFEDNQTSSFKQLIRVLHLSKPVENIMSLLGKKYPATYEEFRESKLPGEFNPDKANKRMKVPIPETWETLVSEKGNKASTWEELIDHNKLPFTAMLRNLRNMMICGIQPHHHKWILNKLTNEQSIANSKQFPLRFLAAFDAIPKDINQLTEWAEEKKTKISYYPAKELFKTYREALDTAVKLSTVHNVNPIRGSTVVFCYVNPSLLNKEASTGARAPKGKQPASKYTVVENAILLSLMCKYVCEDCELFFVGINNQNQIEFLPVAGLQYDSILENMNNLVNTIKEKFSGTSSVTKFPTDTILENYLLPKKRIDNLLVLNDSILEMDKHSINKNILEKYRQDVNPELLFVSIDLSGKSSNIPSEGQHENDVYISGFSDSILKFIAERGGSDQQLQYIEQIDVIKKIKTPSKPGSANATAATEEAEEEVKLQNTIASTTNTAKVEKPWKNVRVFLSSTFLDMHGERDLLVKYIFPELRERCAKRRIHLTEIDLRWGITEEESSKNKSVELCLEEVDKCRPFFIGLLGQRYGWVPPKDKIPADSKYDWIRQLPGGYSRSITELEMHYAAFDSQFPQQNQNCLFYIRDSTFMKEVPKEFKPLFDSEDAGASTKLENFKNTLKSKAKNYYTYSAKWGGVVDGTPSAGGLEDLHQKILEDLWNRIQVVYPLDQDEMENQVDALKNELHQHQLYADLKSKNFVGRKDEISCIAKFLEIPRTFSSSKASKLILNKSNTLLISGKPGSGKTSLISYFLNTSIKETPKHHKAPVPITVIQHFIGSSPNSTDIRKMLSSLCLQLNQKCKLNEVIPIDAEYSELKILFPNLLKKASLKTNKVLVAIDGLDQLDKTNSAHSLDWLPSQVSGQVKLIVSAVDGDHTLNVLKRRKSPPTEVALTPLDQNDRKSLVRNKLAEFRKKLDENADNNQMLLLLSKTDSYNPLYLVLSCEELRYFGVFENLTEKIKSLSQTLPKLFDDILDRLEKDHGKEMIATILGSIACARTPLYEDDMLVILARKDERSLPTSIWSRIYRSIQPFLLSSLDNTEKGLEFFHNQLRLVVLKRYHALSDSSARIHKLIANFYLKKADPESNHSWKGQDSTSFSELPYHLTKSKQITQLESILTNLTFIQKKCQFNLSFELLNDYLNVLGNEDDSDTSSRSSSANKLVKSKESLERFRDFYRFMSSNTHILSRSPELTFQQAFNEPNTSYCHIVAQRSISSHRESWVEWLNKPEIRDSCRQTITGLSQGATCVAYSSDSKYIASAGKDSVIHIYKASNGSEVQTLVGHSNWVSSLSFSSDNKTLASGSWDETVIVWDLIVGKEIITFRNHRRAVNSVEFSPIDNNLLLTASWDSSVIIFNLLEKNAFRYLKAHNKPVNSACWSNDGKLVASCSWDGTIKVWNPFESIAANRLLLVIDESAQHGSIKSCRFSSNSKQIIATTMKNSVLLFDSTSAKLLSVIGTHSKSVNHCSFSDDGQHFVTSSDDGTIKLWSSQLGNQLTEFKVQFDGWVNCLAFSPKESLLAMGCSDCIVRVYDVSGSIYKELYKFHNHTRAISSLTFSASGKLLASTSEDKKITVYDTTKQAISYVIENGHTDIVNCLSFSPLSEQLLVSCSDDYQAKVWEGKTLVSTLSGNNNTVKSCVFSPDGKYIATVSRDCSITLWLVGSYKQIAKLQGHKDWINFVAFSPDSKKLVSGGWDFNIKVWSVANKKELLTIKGHTGSIERGFFSQDKKYIFTCAFDGTVKVWDSEFGTEITSLHHASRISDVVNTTDGSGRIFSTSDDGIVKSWIPVVGKCLTTFTGHSGPIKQSVFSAGQASSGFSSFGSSAKSEFNKSIVSSSDDGTVKIWDFTHQTSSLAVHSGVVNDCAFSVDGKYLATVGNDNTLKIWDPKRPSINLKTFTMESEISCCTFSPTGILIIGCIDGKIEAYDSLKDFENVLSISTPTKSKITTISALPSKAINMYVVGGWNNTVHLLDISTKAFSPISAVQDWIECSAFSPNGEWIAVGGRERSLLLINPNSSSRIVSIPCNAFSVTFSPDSKNIAIGSSTGEVYVYGINERTIAKIEISQTSTITQLAYLDQDRIISVSKDRSLIIWNTAKSVIENEFVQNSPITGLSLHSNLISIIDSNGNLSLLSYHKMK